MTRRDAHAHGDGAQPEVGEPIDERLLAELRSPVAAPDLTRRIMGRLGYMRAAPAVVRRRRVRRSIGRAIVLVIAAASAGLTLLAVEHGPLARTEPGPTIPDAIGRDIERHHRQLERTIEGLQRTIAPTRVIPTRVPGSPGSHGSPFMDRLDDDVDRSAMGPVRWL